MLDISTIGVYCLNFIRYAIIEMATPPQIHIQFRRYDNWSNINLKPGELGIDTSTGQYRINTTSNDLAFSNANTIAIPASYITLIAGDKGSTGNQGMTGWTGTQGSQGSTGSTGWTGTQGTTGIQGSTGSTGWTGTQGWTGVQGTTGYTGTQGTTGYTGSQGSTGWTGSQGTTGYTGTQGTTGWTGTQGTTGWTGIQGTTGYTGTQGTTGTQGLTGWTGSQGTTGWTGTQGTTGWTGSQGTQGWTGIQGTTGWTGTQGTQGTTGWTGTQGTTGTQGSTGWTGTQGTTGWTGTQGTRGAQGSTGSTGTQGSTGTVGTIGTQGSQGWTGWTGWTGTQGNQGSTGWTGTQGTQGSAGSIGTQGLIGTQGSTGSQGVPSVQNFSSITPTASTATANVIYSTSNYANYALNVTMSNTTLSSMSTTVSSTTTPYTIVIGCNSMIPLTNANYGNTFILSSDIYTVSTLAGSGSAGSTNGTGTAASFSNQVDVAVDTQGNIYVTDPLNSMIRKITSGGLVSTFLNSIVSYGIACDPMGNIYVSDYDNNKVKKYSSNGTLLTIIGTGGSGYVNGASNVAAFRVPLGIDSDPLGNIYVADIQNYVIRKIDTNGTVSLYAGIPTGMGGANVPIDGPLGTGNFNQTYRLTFDSFTSNIYMTDYWYNIVRKVTPDGTITTIAGSNGGFAYGSTDGQGLSARFKHPSGITCDYSGNIYVIDQGNNLIRKIDSNSIVTTVAGNTNAGFIDGQGSNSQFNFNDVAQGTSKSGITSDIYGNLFVSDTYNNRIRIITPTRPYSYSSPVLQASTLAGLGPSGFINGVGREAQFYNPTGVACDSSGNIYVGDRSNYVIRKITKDGVVTTFAGSGIQGSADGINAASFSYINGLCIDSSSNIYVMDSENFVIRKVTPNGYVSTYAGSNGVNGYVDGLSGVARLTNSMNGIAIDSSSNLYISDSTKYTVRKITPNGTVSTIAGSNGVFGYVDAQGSAARFRDLYGGLVCDSYSNIYVCDYSNFRIRKIDVNSNVTTFVGSTDSYSDGQGTNASIHYMGGMTIDPYGNLYVTQVWGESKIIKITVGGFVTNICGGIFNNDTHIDGVGSNVGFHRPAAITCDTVGNFYVAELDDVYSSIRKLTAPPTFSYETTYKNVQVTTFAGSGTAGYADGQGTAASFSNVRGLAFNSAGDMYVADYCNNRIRKITGGLVSTFAGSGTEGYAGGQGTVATFANPSGVACDSAGNVYVTDMGTNYLRKITPSGLVSTLIVGIYYAQDITCEPTSQTIYIAGYTGHLVARLITNNTAIQIIAGSGVSGYSNAQGTDARFNHPWSVVADSFQNLYVSDYGNHCIRKIDRDSNVTLLAGTPQVSGFADGQGSNAKFNNPRNITRDSLGNLYVADGGNNCIRKIDVNSNVTTVAGSAAGYVNSIGSLASFRNPNGIALDPLGNLYVGESGNNLVRKITPLPTFTCGESSETVQVTTFAGSGDQGGYDAQGTAATFFGAWAVTVDSTGNVYVVDTWSRIIRKITPAGAVTTFAGVYTGSGSGSLVDGPANASYFNNPIGIAVDLSGNVYVADTGNNCIRRIAGGQVITFAGKSTAGFLDAIGSNAQFSGPTGVACDSVGNLYVADAGNNRIRYINTTTSNVTTFSGSTAGSADGAIGIATFSNPYSITLDLSGNIYVVDNSTKVRKISNNTVSTIITNSPNGTYGVAAAIAVDYGGNIYLTDYENTSYIIKVTPSGLFSNIAGSGYGLTDGYGSVAKFKHPAGIACDSVGNLYVADTYNNVIRLLTPLPTPQRYIIDSNVQVSTLAGSGAIGSNDGQGTAAKFHYPTDVTCDYAGNIYITDTGNNIIRKITPGGLVSTFAGSAAAAFADGQGTSASFYRPYFMVFDLFGNLIVSDSFNNRIRKITPSGFVSTLAGSGIQGSADGPGSNATFSEPSGIVCDSAGNIFVSDCTGNKIRKIDINSNVTTFAGSGVGASVDGQGTAASFNGPRGITIDSFGNLYISDFNNNIIRKIDTSANVTTFAGSGVDGSVDGQGKAASFYRPNGITCDPIGNIYVAETYGNTIRKITPSGYVSTVAGTGRSSSADNTTGLNAGFDTPYGIGINAAGVLYVVDTYGQRIRTVTPTTPYPFYVNVKNANSNTRQISVLNTTMQSTIYTTGPANCNLYPASTNLSGNSALSIVYASQYSSWNLY